MARVRSPNYPAMSLPEAIKAIGTIQAAEQHLVAPKEVAAKHIGYTTYHGLAKRMIAALENYGLLEEVAGDKVKVSQRAVSILFPSTAQEKQTAINEAAFQHPLFLAIKEEWQGARPSDENLRVFLIRRKFAADALDRVIEVYRQTMDLVTKESGEDVAENPDPKSQHQEKPMIPGHQSPRVALPPPGAPMRISFNGELLEVSAIIADGEAVDRLVKALQANKALLPDKPPKKEEAAN